MSQPSNLILHLVAATEYRSLPDSAPFLPGGFEADGFIHCTREPEVLLEVANALYRDVPGDFLVLLIDPSRLKAALRYEPPLPAPPAGTPLAGHLFPHIYGPLNRDAIAAVRPARRAPDGTFIAV